MTEDGLVQLRLKKEHFNKTKSAKLSLIITQVILTVTKGLKVTEVTRWQHKLFKQLEGTVSNKDSLLPALERGDRGADMVWDCMWL